MNKQLKKGLQYSFFLGLGIFLTYWQYSKMTSEERDFFMNSIKEANYLYILPVIVMSLLSHLSRAVRWRYLMEPIGYQPLLSNTFATVMIGYLVNSLAPRAGEIAKCTLLGKKEKIPIDKLIGTILIERAIDLLCYFVIIVITISLQYERIEAFLKEFYSKAVMNGGMHPLLKLGIIVAIIIAIVLLLKFTIKRFSKNKFIDKFKDSIHGVKDGFQSIKKLQKKKLFWMHTLIIWTLYLLQIYVGFKAMSFVAHLGFDASFSVLALATLAMILTPGGIGSFPIAVAQILVLYNITYNAALSFGWLMWAATTTIILVVGVLCFIWFEFNKQSSHVQSKI
jgi:glycosyltransferase 2 family protein